MELKFCRWILLSLLVHGFNCTFMELKLKKRAYGTPQYEGFNCTFMELKYITTVSKIERVKF